MDEKLFGKGILDRPSDPKDPRDFRHEEIASAFSPAVWVEKAPQNFFFIPTTDQAQSSSCVSHKFAKQLGTDLINVNNGTYRALSPHSIYPYGAQPGGGMNVRTAATIVTNHARPLRTQMLRGPNPSAHE